MTESKSSLFDRLPGGKVSIGRTVSTFTAAAMMGCSPGTVLLRIEEGALRAFRHGPRGHWRIEYESVVEYVARMHRQAQGLEEDQ